MATMRVFLKGLASDKMSFRMPMLIDPVFQPLSERRLLYRKTYILAFSLSFMNDIENEDFQYHSSSKSLSTSCSKQVPCRKLSSSGPHGNLDIMPVPLPLALSWPMYLNVLCVLPC